MTSPASLRHLLRLACAVALLVCGAAALAQADPPGRVGRLNHAEGTVTFSPAGDNEWVDAPRNRPLTRGDRLWTDRGSRAELQVGSSAIRLSGLTRLEIVELDDHTARLSLLQGSLYVRVRSLPEGENFEIDTPNLAYRAAYPGDYRVDVDADLGTTRVTIHSGTGAVYGEGGQVQPLGGGQQVTFHGRALAQLEARESPPQDGFDRWAEERNRREDQSIAARYVPREVVGYQQLDPHGQWVRDATHGAIWFPQGVAPDWAPYRRGHWEWIAPWGWNWIDDAPWGFAPFHYGRWALVGGRWAWVPGRLSLRPVYAPALVAFVGGSRGILPGSAAPGEVAWFPLAPGEMWQPGFRASMAYISNANRNMAPGQGDTPYAYQRRREALTAISREDFHRGQPVAASWLRVAALTLTSATIVPPPPMPQRTALAAAGAAASRTAAATPAPVRPVASPAASPASVQTVAQAAADAQRSRTPATPPSLPRPAPAAPAIAAVQLPKPPATAAVQAQARPPALQRPRAEQPRRTEAAAAASPPPNTAVTAQQAATARAESARRAAAQQREQAVARAAPTRREQTQRAERARRDQATARLEQTRREQQARRDQLAQREQQAKRQETARREALARRDEQARRHAQALRDQQVQREARARHDEQLRREARAHQVELARRAADRDAQALQQQRLQRDEQARRAAQDRDQAQREAWQREQQQAAMEQWRRDRQASDQPARPRARPRPSLQPEWRDDARDRPPEVWQRGIPILSPGRTS